MARSLQPAGYVPIPPGAWSIGSPIAISGLGGYGGIDDFARNVNTVFAERSPQLIAQHTPSGASERQIETTSNAWQVHLVYVIPTGEDPRDQLVGRVLYSTTAGEAAEIQVTTYDEATNVVASTATVLPAAATPTWFPWDAVAVNSGVPGTRTIVEVSFRVDNGATLAVRALAAWLEPATVLGAGTVYQALDDAQFGANRPYTAETSKLADTITTQLYEQYTPPIFSYSADLVSGSSKLGWGFTAGYLTKIGTSINVYARPGERIEKAKYALLVERGVGILSNVYVRATLPDGTILDEVTHVDPPNAPNYKDIGDWLTGEITLSRRVDLPVQISLWGQYMGLDAPPLVSLDTTCYSMCFWAKER